MAMTHVGLFPCPAMGEKDIIAPKYKEQGDGGSEMRERSVLEIGALYTCQADR